MVIKHGKQVVKFYSKSASEREPRRMGGVRDWRKYLSNFTHASVEYNNIMFPSVEHGFGHAKYQHSTKTREDATMPDFTDASLAGANLKREHGNAKAGLKKGYGMRFHGYALDVDAWNAVRVDVTRTLLASRFKRDDTFRKILQDLHTQGYYLLHVERSGPRSFWGGSDASGAVQGENMLGKIMMELMDDEMNDER